jgi:hypothetical protein
LLDKPKRYLRRHEHHREARNPGLDRLIGQKTRQNQDPAASRGEVAIFRGTKRTRAPTRYADNQ